MSLARLQLKKIYVARLKGFAEQKDENGFYTGVNLKEYHKPFEIKGSFRTIRNQKDIEMFGVDTSFDGVLTLASRTQEILETDILFFDKEPEMENGILLKNGYRVSRIISGVEYRTIAVTNE